MKLKQALATGLLLAAPLVQATNFRNTEPNNTFESAQVLEHDGRIFLDAPVVSATNFPVDYFRFAAKAGDHITVDYQIIGASWDRLSFTLFDSSRALIATFDERGVYEFDIGATDNYFIRMGGRFFEYQNSALPWYFFSIADLTPTLVTAVPEPETYTMMLAGLGLLGFAARRRKAQTAQV